VIAFSGFHIETASYYVMFTIFDSLIDTSLKTVFTQGFDIQLSVIRVISPTAFDHAGILAVRYPNLGKSNSNISRELLGYWSEC
jgi:hypothetical protein